ncbi:MAG TPA: flagellar protein export ATPase FliI [Thermotogota bacterium]|nr:flagellar protein export ATPase FliI [Thermotogota bacterium]HRW33876.1 flagellar protein export ATPase FliI [Thermotogota bacterium]
MIFESLKKFDYLKDLFSEHDFLHLNGSVKKIIGLTIESAGPEVFLGECCRIKTLDGKTILSEVVGFKDNHIILMPLDEFSGISLGCEVQGTKRNLSIGVDEEILGRVLDGLGRPLDGKNIFVKNHASLNNKPPNPMVRNRIKEVIPVGIRAIDGFTTLGMGQRIGIFAGSGVGKSTLLGMIARNTKADINVIGLIGERGREVREFIERDLGEEGLKRSVVLVSTSDQPALMRVKALQSATSVAEFFRDRGYNVMLMVDSLTRWAMAQRDVGLAIGEPPTTRGYPPSVFAGLPGILERAGNSEKGSITGIYTVLVEGDDFNEPISDTVRGVVDGHIILSRSLAESNHYPAIDVLASISRLMTEIVDREHMSASRKLKDLMAVYNDAKDLIDIGAYKSGSDLKIDKAIELINPINQFLRQEVEEKVDFNQMVERIKDISRKIELEKDEKKAQ